MSDVELIKQAIEKGLDKLLADFNKTLEKYYLSDLEVIEVKLGLKDDQVKVGKAAILDEFNAILEVNDFKELYAAAFTLAKKTGREGFCQVKREGFWFTIRCGS